MVQLMSVRVRYAPSPTGLQHIGGVRTALFNYLFAKSQGGKFILRIEDTDRERFSPDALEDIYQTFDWLGISEDEGPRTGGAEAPYLQSERLHTYQQKAAELVERGHAYPCFCSAERLDELRQAQARTKGSSQGYDRLCRSLPAGEAKARLEAREPHVIRFKIPLEGETAFDDLILGRITRQNGDISPDPVILKSDGFPTYHLANVIDDHAMRISHILRAQEWIPSGPLHVLLYQAFGWEPPQYVHLPMVMGQDGQKLSKRHGSTAVREFRQEGYLPEAIINYLALLGWSLDDRTEIFSLSDLEKIFDLNRLQKSPASFDYKKLQWFNAHYLRLKSDAALLEEITPFLEKDGLLLESSKKEQQEKLLAALPLIRDRITLPSQAAEVIGFALREDLEYEAGLLIPKGLDQEQTADALGRVLEQVDRLFQGGEEEAEHVFVELAQSMGRKTGQVMMPVRIAITGTKASPPLSASIRLIGRERTIERLSRAIELINTQGSGQHSEESRPNG